MSHWPSALARQIRPLLARIPAPVRRRLTRLRRPHGRAEWLAAIGAGAALLTLIGWLAWPDADEPPRARQYRDVTACLLTGADGLQGEQAGAVWAGMQEESARTRVRVQYLAAADAVSVEDTMPYVVSLAQGGCRIVVVAGGLPGDAVYRAAGRFPEVRFVVIGGSAAQGNVSVAPTGPPSRLRVTGADAVSRVDRSRD
jgi:hypothetical protein